MKFKGTLLLLCLLSLVFTTRGMSQDAPDPLAIRGGFAQALNN